MSMFSIFYLGDRGDVLSELAGENSLGARPESVDFSGGIGTPLLIADDFDALFRFASKGELQTFAQVWSELILGQSGNASEHQAHVLTQAGVELLATLTDDQIHEFSRDWNAARDREHLRHGPAIKRERVERRIRVEVAFWALPVALVIGIPLAEHGTLPLWAKVFFPSLVVAGALLARRYLRQGFGAFKTVVPPPPVAVDWFPVLGDLRGLCRKAGKEGKDVVYYWSL